MEKVIRKYYTVKEAAVILRLSQHSIRDYIKANKIPAIRIGKHWRIPASFLEG